ncbi:gdnf-inducible Zinc finger protein 1 [Plakobranchus ocellatus]|uniref:Gdnf-inducible Zinc finger protein 1 n=1 Tax=Plakobranchus ocellatus TaxID=259542 RepID=A0AAV3Y1T4_9GAST|nr:gdnf-inducible Zinc finger protein 1 [Plakobranchus ocellatus]
MEFDVKPFSFATVDIADDYLRNFQHGFKENFIKLFKTLCLELNTDLIPSEKSITVKGSWDVIVSIESFLTSLLPVLHQFKSRKGSERDRLNNFDHTFSSCLNLFLDGNQLWKYKNVTGDKSATSEHTVVDSKKNYHLDKDQKDDEQVQNATGMESDCSPFLEKAENQSKKYKNDQQKTDKEFTVVAKRSSVQDNDQAEYFSCNVRDHSISEQSKTHQYKTRGKKLSNFPARPACKSAHELELIKKPQALKSQRSSHSISPVLQTENQIVIPNPSHSKNARARTLPAKNKKTAHFFCKNKNAEKNPRRPVEKFKVKTFEKGVSNVANESKNSDTIFACVECPYVSQKSVQLEDHKKRVHQVKQFRCAECEKEFGFRKDLRRHMKCHGKAEHSCDLCGKMYKEARKLKMHKETHASNYVKPLFPCKQCSKSFSTKYVLAYHVKSEHLGMKASYTCSTCGKSYAQKSSYIQHSNIHIGVKPFYCSVCEMQFSHEKTLKEHMFVHADRKSFMCKVCNKPFRQSSGLTIHMRIHKETKDYVCSVCGKGFSQRQALLRHERIHAGEKPFECCLCGRCFADSSVLRRHMISVHKRNPKLWQQDTRRPTTTLKGADSECNLPAGSDPKSKRIFSDILKQTSKAENQLVSRGSKTSDKQQRYECGKEVEKTESPCATNEENQTTSINNSVIHNSGINAVSDRQLVSSHPGYGASFLATLAKQYSEAPSSTLCPIAQVVVGSFKKVENLSIPSEALQVNSPLATHCQVVSRQSVDSELSSRSSVQVPQLDQSHVENILTRL